jgi:hypothetical protein
MATDEISSAFRGAIEYAKERLLMTTEQQDETNWFTEGSGLAERIENDLTEIMGRQVLWCLLVFPRPGKTLSATRLNDEALKTALQNVLAKFESMKFEDHEV